MNPSEAAAQHLEDAKARMSATVRALLHATEAERHTLAANLKPTRADLNQVFLPEAVAPLAHYFDRIYANNPQPAPAVGQDQILLRVTLAGLLREDNPFSRPFPGGYRRVAPFMLPLVPWGVWRFHSGDPNKAMAYDGLVALDDRVVWLPRPYRAVPRAPAT